MKLHKDYGVNPFSGCWPVLLQFPIRRDKITGASVAAASDPRPHRERPVRGRVAADPRDAASGRSEREPITTQAQNQRPELPASDLGHLVPGDEPALLGGARGQPGRDARREDATGRPGVPVNCGSEVVDRIPYYIFAALMFGTTFSPTAPDAEGDPSGGALSQQQALARDHADHALRRSSASSLPRRPRCPVLTTSIGWRTSVKGGTSCSRRQSVTGTSELWAEEREVQAAGRRLEKKGFMHLRRWSARSSSESSGGTPEAGHQAARNHPKPPAPEGRDQSAPLGSGPTKPGSKPGSNPKRIRVRSATAVEEHPKKRPFAMLEEALEAAPRRELPV